jgi:hypothetical protein
MYKFKIGDIANGVETSETIVEANDYIQALERVVASANLYVKGADEESDSHIGWLLSHMGR